MEMRNFMIARKRVLDQEDRFGCKVSGEEKEALKTSVLHRQPNISFKNTVVNLNIDMIGRIGDFHNHRIMYI